MLLSLAECIHVGNFENWRCFREYYLVNCRIMISCEKPYKRKKNVSVVEDNHTGNMFNRVLADVFNKPVPNSKAVHFSWKKNVRFETCIASSDRCKRLFLLWWIWLRCFLGYKDMRHVTYLRKYNSEPVSKLSSCLFWPHQNTNHALNVRGLAIKS